MEFWSGFATAVLVYFTIGFSMGLYIVITHLDRFHGGGFGWRRMADHVGKLTLFWPAAVLEFLE